MTLSWCAHAQDAASSNSSHYARVRQQRARLLSATAFSLRRPSVQLVTELAPLLADPAGQLVLAHLVRRTCDLAATEGAEAAARCEEQLAAGAAESCWRDYRAAASLAERTLAISCLGNLRSARARELLRPVAGGEVRPGECWVQVAAVRAAPAPQLHLAIFLNTSHCHPARIAALDQLFAHTEADM